MQLQQEGEPQLCCIPGVPLLPSGLCQHLGLQWRASSSLLCSLLCATHVTVPLLVTCLELVSPPPEICD